VTEPRMSLKTGEGNTEERNEKDFSAIVGDGETKREILWQVGERNRRSFIERESGASRSSA
jgi:hypothetical protein